MKNFYSKLVFAFCFALVSMAVFAQQRMVIGQVTDEAGVPLAGATIVIAGTPLGALTDVDGKFSLTVSGSNVILQTSFIVYISK